jgi:hypothetical protein
MPRSTAQSWPPLPRRIVSGGQTGVDRGGLEAAIAFGLGHGGWCPLGRLAEDGSIPSRYSLEELDSPDYADRTLQNVLDSDATLILYEGPLSGGTLLTLNLARKHHRPHLARRLDHHWDPAKVAAWLRQQRPETLNVAGPRESSRPGIEQRTRDALLQVLTQLASAS